MLTGNIGGVGYENARLPKRIIQPLGSQLPDQLNLVPRVQLLQALVGNLIGGLQDFGVAFTINDGLTPRHLAEVFNHLG